MQEIFGGPVPLASSKDLKNFDKILADARTANTQGRYQDSESLFRKALDLQTKLLNERDISIAETLMDLALNVSNQGRDEEALALFRRADPIIQVSRLMTLIELGLPLIKATMRQILNDMIKLSVCLRSCWLLA